LKRRNFQYAEIREKRTYTVNGVGSLLCVRVSYDLKSVSRDPHHFMSIYKQNRHFFSQPYRITPEQTANPVSVFAAFFDYMHLHQAREAIAELLEAVLTSQNEEYSRPVDRANAISICRKLEEVLEAAWLLHKSADASATN
jgi:hypothetical protein